MGKIIFWMVVVFAVLFALRLWNARQLRKRGEAPAKPVDAQAMVRCTNCGVFLPRGDARLVDGAYRCHDGGCSAHPPH